MSEYVHIDADVMYKKLRKSEEYRYGRGRMACYPRPVGAPGLQIVGSFNQSPDKLVSPGDYKDLIVMLNDNEAMPMHYQLDSERGWIQKLKGNWNQNGLSYCWAWSLTAALMDAWCREDKDPVLLAPISLGPAVRWANKGNYLENGLQFVVDNGIASVDFCPQESWHRRDPSLFKTDWQGDALLHRLDPKSVNRMDSNTKTSMIQHCITALRQCDPIYIAYYWWGHALEVIGVEWDESVKYNIAWIIRNSHDESKPIRLTGDRAVPDEGFSIGATMTYSEAA